jgi:hypothetical protein
VEKITQTAAAQGITGDKPQADSSGLNPFLGGTRNGARVVYSSKSGWETPLAAGLSSATEKALASAKAIARGAGLRIENVVSIEEIAEAPHASAPAAASPYASLFGLSSSPAEDDYADGELVRKVRVKVKVTVVK